MYFYIYPTIIGSEYFKHGTTEALVAAAKETGLELSAEKSKFMVTSRDQNAGRIHCFRIDNSTFERMELFKYFRNKFNKSKFYYRKIKSRLMSGNACYYSVQNL